MPTRYSLQHQVDRAERHQHQKEREQVADEQLQPGTGPFQPIVDEASLAPQIAPHPRARPEGIDAERNDRQREIGEGDRRELLPCAGETESAAADLRLARRRMIVSVVHQDTPRFTPVERKPGGGSMAICEFAQRASAIAPGAAANVTG
jgi:hypothetical protein